MNKRAALEVYFETVLSSYAFSQSTIEDDDSARRNFTEKVAVDIISDLERMSVLDIGKEYISFGYKVDSYTGAGGAAGERPSGSIVENWEQKFTDIKFSGGSGGGSSNSTEANANSKVEGFKYPSNVKTQKAIDTVMESAREIEIPSTSYIDCKCSACVKIRSETSVNVYCANCDCISCRIDRGDRPEVREFSGSTDDDESKRPLAPKARKK